MTFDCRKCGACCAFFNVELSTEEALCLPQTLVACYTKIPSMLCLAGTGEPHRGNRELNVVVQSNRCRALEGEIGKACTCAIYPIQPKVCREFPVGGEGCLMARKYYGLEV